MNITDECIAVKENLHFCKKLTLNCCEIISNLKILQVEGEITFNNNHKWKSLWPLNFQRAAILDFYDVLWLPLLFGSFQRIF